MCVFLAQAFLFCLCNQYLLKNYTLLLSIRKEIQVDQLAKFTKTEKDPDFC